MELVISISRVTRFVRVGGNALGVKLPTNIPYKSTLQTQVKPAQPKRLPILNKQHVITAASELKQRPRLMSHIGLSLLVVLVVLVGGLNAAESSTGLEDTPPVGPLSALATESGYGGLVDETASAYIAAGVAQAVEMPLADQVAQDVQNLTSQSLSNSEDYLSKPQVVATNGSVARGIQKYVTAEGDTVDAVAAKFGISANTVRWANNLTEGTEPSAGQELTILPINGVLHTVSDTDTPQGLGLVYQTSAELIVSYNDAELDGLKPGSQIIIPNGVIAASPRTPSASFLAGSYIINNAFRPSYGGNGYDYGWCTWGAANKRAASGRPIPSNWGNAIAWRYNAASSGYAIGSTPQPGAIVYHNDSYGWGHVAYVEQVYPDGSARFSDMNYPVWGGYTERVVQANQMGAYSFIY